MKFLIAFAVITVAVAAEEVRVVRLPPAPAPVVETRPEVVPQYILEALKALPVSENEDILRVNFVDAPVEIDGFNAYAPETVAYSYSNSVASEDAPDGLPVSENLDILRDAPVEIAYAPELNVVYTYSNTFANEDAPEALPVSENEDSFGVNFVDAPVEMDGSKSYVPEQNVVSDNLDILRDAPVEMVYAPELNVVYTYSNTFANQDAPEALPVSENEDSFRVNFVDAPVEMDGSKSYVPEQNVVYSSDSSFTYENNAESLNNVMVDTPVSFQNFAEQIKVVKIPLAESQDESFAPEDLTVKVVQTASVAEETADAAPADEDSLKVRFVDSPQAEPIEAVKIAEPVIKSEVPTLEAIKIVDAIRLGKFADPRLR